MKEAFASPPAQDRGKYRAGSRRPGNPARKLAFEERHVIEQLLNQLPFLRRQLALHSGLGTPQAWGSAHPVIIYHGSDSAGRAETSSYRCVPA